MKKILLVVASALTLTLCLSSCGSDNNNNDNNHGTVIVNYKVEPYVSDCQIDTIWEKQYTGKLVSNMSAQPTTIQVDSVSTVQGEYNVLFTKTYGDCELANQTKSITVEPGKTSTISVDVKPAAQKLTNKKPTGDVISLNQ